MENGAQVAQAIPDTAIHKAAWDMQLGADCVISHVSYRSSVGVLLEELRELGWTLLPPSEHLEITPKMIAAGHEAIASRWIEFVGTTGYRIMDEVLREVFSSMWSASPPAPSEARTSGGGFLSEEDRWEELLVDAALGPFAEPRTASSIPATEDRSQLTLVGRLRRSQGEVEIRLHEPEPLLSHEGR